MPTQQGPPVAEGHPLERMENVACDEVLSFSVMVFLMGELPLATSVVAPSARSQSSVLTPRKSISNLNPDDRRSAEKPTDAKSPRRTDPFQNHVREDSLQSMDSVNVHVGHSRPVGSQAVKPGFHQVHYEGRFLGSSPRKMYPQL